MLYLADHLEPGRRLERDARAALRVRMPAERDPVLTAMAQRRLEWIVRFGWRLAPETVAFWNTLATA